MPVRLDVEVASEAASRGLTWTLAPASDGDGAAVLVERVLSGELERLGVRAGDRLRELSDPVRETEMWTVGPRPSLSRIRDALRMRRSSAVRLVFERAPEEQRQQQQQGYSSPPRTPSTAESTLDGLLGTAASVDDEDDDSGERAASSPPPPQPQPPTLTIGERMAAQQAAAIEASRGVSERQARRKAYLEDQDERAIAGGGGTRFLLAAASAFVLPAAIVLAVAYSQGLLDPGRFVGP